MEVHYLLSWENCYRRLKNKWQHMVYRVKIFGKTVTCVSLEIRQVHKCMTLLVRQNLNNFTLLLISAFLQSLKDRNELKKELVCLPAGMKALSEVFKDEKGPGFEIRGLFISQLNHLLQHGVSVKNKWFLFWLQTTPKCHQLSADV